MGSSARRAAPGRAFQSLTFSRPSERIIDRHGQQNRTGSPDRRPPVSARHQVRAEDRRRGPRHIDKWFLDQAPVH